MAGSELEGELEPEDVAFEALHRVASWKPFHFESEVLGFRGGISGGVSGLGHHIRMLSKKPLAVEMAHVVGVFENPYF